MKIIVRCTVGALVFLFVGAALGSVAGAHSGGTDENGCHAGSQPYHCHNGGGGGSPSAPPSTIDTTPPPAPVDSTPPAPVETLPPTPGAGASTGVVDPVPTEVAGVSSSRAAAPAAAASSELAKTGASTWVLLGVAALLVLFGGRLTKIGYEHLNWIAGRPGSNIRFTVDSVRSRKRSRR